MNSCYKYFAIASIAFLLLGCEQKEPLEAAQELNFESVFEIANPSARYGINDTVWLSSVIPYSLEETNSEQLINFADAQLSINCIVRKWDQSNATNLGNFSQYAFNTTCNYISRTSNAQILGLVYKGEGDSLRVDIGISFQEHGIYSIDFDYLEMENEIENVSNFYGGGFIQFFDEYNQYGEGYLAGIFEHDNNFSLYQNLSEDAKSMFQLVDESNYKHYYFLSVN